MATSEPVVIHHGRGRRRRSRRGAAVCFNSLLGSALRAEKGSVDCLYDGKGQDMQSVDLLARDANLGKRVLRRRHDFRVVSAIDRPAE